MMNQRQIMYDALVAHANGQIAKHKANVNIYLNQSIGIGEHSDIIETIEKEINKIGHYEEQLSVLEKHFKDNTL